MSHFLLKNHDLKNLNWWKVGGRAEYFAAPKTIDELKNVYGWAVREKIKTWIISGGSNVLIQDGLITGLVLSLHDFKGIESSQIVHNKNGSECVRIECLAGTPKSDLAKYFLQNKLAPAIFLTGIPGDVGGGVVMNAGIGENRVPREFCEIVTEIEILRADDVSGEVRAYKFLSQDLIWKYRHSSGWQPGVITKVVIEWPNKIEPSVLIDVKEQTKKRITTQPLDLPSCGSVFRNPHGYKSAQLIESCGLKGYRVGGACVSTKHANFIVNDQEAKAQDVKSVIDHVKATVLKQKGIELMAEVVLIGEWL